MLQPMVTMFRRIKVPQLFVSFAIGLSLSSWSPLVAAQLDPQRVASTAAVGTGFAVTSRGHLLTNAHVVEGCTSVEVLSGSTTSPGKILARDSQNDLALISTSMSTPTYATFRRTAPRTGEDVIAIGFPYHGLLASDINVSVGVIGATAGLRNDTSRLQISAPVQPGNSGGPLLDNTGSLLGVIVSKLNALSIAKTYGDIPQNINFAIKADIAQIFMRSHGTEPRLSEVAPKRQSTADIAMAARSYTFLVTCDPASKGSKASTTSRSTERAELPSPNISPPAPKPAPTTEGSIVPRLVILGRAPWCNVTFSGKSYANYAECIHPNEETCRKLSHYCQTIQAVNEHNGRQSGQVSPSPNPAVSTPPTISESTWQITGDGAWCIVWRQTADCRFHEGSCAGRGSECRPRSSF